MGATTFSTVANGETAAVAFSEAVADAQYEYGHGGYTGTIAEKGAFIEYKVPEGMTAKAFVRAVMDYDGEAGVVPAAHHELIKRAAREVDDKWGPCGAVMFEPGRWVFFGWASE